MKPKLPVKQNVQYKIVKLLAIPQINTSLIPGLCLPPPDSHNTGGYRILVTPKKYIWAYSPVDLTVMALSLRINSSKTIVEINNLSKWFNNQTNLLGLWETYLTFLMKDGTYTRNIAEWQFFLKSEPRYLSVKIFKLLKRNAPFSMRRFKL